MLVFDWKHMRTMSEQRQTVQKESWTWHENRQQSINHSMQTTKKKKETECKKRKINKSMCQNGREIKIERENISNGQMIKSEKSRRKPRRKNNSWPKRKVYLKNKNIFFKNVPHVVAILRCNIAHPPLTLHCVCSPTELCRRLDL